MDDLESLVYSIWYISGVDMVNIHTEFFNSFSIQEIYYHFMLQIRRRVGDETEGFLLNKCTKSEAKARVLVSGENLFSIEFSQDWNRMNVD